MWVFFVCFFNAMCCCPNLDSACEGLTLTLNISKIVLILLNHSVLVVTFRWANIFFFKKNYPLSPPLLCFTRPVVSLNVKEATYRGINVHSKGGEMKMLHILTTTWYFHWYFHNTFLELDAVNQHTHFTMLAKMLQDLMLLITRE